MGAAHHQHSRLARMVYGFAFYGASIDDLFRLAHRGKIVLALAQPL